MGGVQDLTTGRAIRYLARHESVSGSAEARLLAGGVSNTVVLVEDGALRAVLKQSLGQLRVRDEWLADRTRIVREWEVMGAVQRVLPPGRIPELLFLDRRRFLYGMRAAPSGCEDWKSRLLRGELSAETARLAGATLGLMARGTWERPHLRERFSDAKAFDQLRTDPYYRTVAARHPGIAGEVYRWIEQSRRRRVAMVHGDWSPKNLLVGEDELLCIDFECAHFGDPSYDAAFVLNHLILKAFNRPELARAYLQLARTAFGWTLGMLPPAALDWYEAATTRHLAFLMLARIDGKSPVEYLEADSVRDSVRQLALRLVGCTPARLEQVFLLVGESLEALSASATRRP